MIVIRRILAVLLIIVFIPVFLATLVIFRTNQTLLSPDFYTKQLRSADLYNFLYGDWVVSEVDKQLRGGGSSLPLNLTGAKVVSAVKQIAPPEWLQTHTEGAIKQVVPYFVGDTENFKVTVPLSDRAEIAVKVIKDLLKNSDLYDYVFGNVITPALEQNIGQTMQLPYGAAITNQEVTAVIKQVLTRQWVQLQLDASIDSVTPYFIGKVDNFTVTVQLADRKRAAVQAIGDLIDRKLKEIYQRLPQCSLQQLQQILQGTLRDPVCVPPGYSYEQLKLALGVDTASMASPVINTALPDKFTFTSADLRQTLSQQGGTGALEQLDNVRKTLKQGWTFTDADLRNQLAQRDDNKITDNLNDARSRIHLVRTLLPVSLLVVAIFLALISFLGGRGWYGRLRWASVALFLAAAITIAAAIVSQTLVLGVIKEMDLAGDVPKEVASKIQQIILNVSTDFLGGIQTLAIILLVVSLAGVVASIVLGRRRQSAQAPARQ